MNLNHDFSERVLLHADEIEWRASPMKGVHRRMLDRVGDEVARATTIVRYAPGSHFSAHRHGGGEEFIVLEGVFQDEHGDYPVGSYIRNPPTSAHTPGSESGCVIFVKLWQFDPEDRTQVKIDMNKMQDVPVANLPGISRLPLFKHAHETVSCGTWEADVSIAIDAPDGLELLVLSGRFITDQGEALRPQSWLRVPSGEALRATAGPHGARVWIKTRHLRNVATSSA